MLFECSKSWRQIFIIKTEKYGECHAKIESKRISSPVYFQRVIIDSLIVSDF